MAVTAQQSAVDTARDRVRATWTAGDFGRIAVGYERGAAEFIARLQLRAGERVLDVACGTGNFTRDFARAVGPDGLVVGFDASETMLRRAVAETSGTGLEQVAYVRGDVIDMPFREQSFDAVCCFAALNLFAEPMAALDSMTAMLTPGGRIAICTSARTRSAPLRTFESIVRSQSGIHKFERRELVDALEQRGYAQIRQRITGFTQFVGGRLEG